MAIDKKLICFKTQANFEARLDAGDIHDYSIVFIKDTQKIWTHGVYFSSLKELRETLASKQEQLPIGEENQVLTTTAEGLAWVDLEHYDDTELQTKLASLQSDMDTLVKGKNADGVIKTLKEVEEFLAGITDATTLKELLANLKEEILSEFPDLSNYVTSKELDERIEEALYETDGLEIEYVDLGLPSGLLWATCNLGAKTETDYGLYFQWGDTKGYKTACNEDESDGNDDAHYFGWSKYKYCDGSSTTMTKYCTNYYDGTVDNKTVLEPEDDAATVMLGGQWRMPTLVEFQELIENTEPADGTDKNGWTNNYNGTGIKGCYRKSKTNGKTIFFPAAGYGTGNMIYPTGTVNCCWSSSLSDIVNSTAWELSCTSLNTTLQTARSERWRGRSIRAVIPSIPKKPKFQPRLPEGEAGQVLTKTEDGVEWRTISQGESCDCAELTLEELDEIIKANGPVKVTITTTKGSDVLLLENTPELQGVIEDSFPIDTVARWSSLGGCSVTMDKVSRFYAPQVIAEPYDVVLTGPKVGSAQTEAPQIWFNNMKQQFYGFVIGNWESIKDIIYTSGNFGQAGNIKISKV